ncbi:MAG: hypothetical protein ABJO01_11300 [Parasphingorhabdus sp.]|uniref:hypothetical protein n=1 Tax=Parasphingorhabdus sp. TaxID=2709688 RepID=UPI003296B081
MSRASVVDAVQPKRDVPPSAQSLPYAMTAFSVGIWARTYSTQMTGMRTKRHFAAPAQVAAFGKQKLDIPLLWRYAPTI